MTAFQEWADVFAVIKPIADRYGFSIHKGWRHLINKEVKLSLKIRVSKNSKNQDMIEIEPVNGTQSKAKEQLWCSRLDVFFQIPIQFEDWIRESIGLPSLAERDRQLSEIAAEIERCDHALVLSELNPIADPSETQKAKEYKERLYDEIKRIDPIAPSDQSDEDLLIELGVLPSRMEAPQEIQQDALIAYLSALDTPTLEAMSSLDWSTFDHDPSVIEITRDAIAAELGKRKATSSDDLNPSVILELPQPWAWAATSGLVNTIPEQWAPKYAGPISIFAKYTHQSQFQANALEIAKIAGISVWDLPMSDDLPHGAIVGRAILVDATQRWDSDGSLYGWVLASPVQIDPIPCSGSLALHGNSIRAVEKSALAAIAVSAEAEISHSDPIAALECFEEYKEVLAILGIGSEDSLTDVALILHEAIRDPAYDKHGLHVPLFEAEEKLDPEIPLIPPSGSQPVYHPQIPQIEPEAINVEAVEVKQQWVGPRQAVYRNLLGEITSIEMIDKPKKPKNTNPNQLGLF